MSQKAVFLFPGQGAQYVGMGKELADVYPVVQATYAEADEVLGYRLSRLCFEGPEDELLRTENTQPAILATSVAFTRLLTELGWEPSAAAGLSLGEYGALVAAGTMEYRDALKLVRQRGIFMQEAVPVGQGTMAAIIGLDRALVEELCRQALNGAVVEPANYNCPGQVVVAGHVEAVERAMELARERGAKRAIRLAVSAPFHSSLLEPAARRLAGVLSGVALNSAAIPVVANVSAEYVRRPEEIRQALVRQVASPVRWEESMVRLVEDGHHDFLEVGPGRVLQGFMKRINRGARVRSVEDCHSLQRLLESPGEVC